MKEFFEEIQTMSYAERDILLHNLIQEVTDLQEGVDQVETNEYLERIEPQLEKLDKQIFLLFYYSMDEDELDMAAKKLVKTQRKVFSRYIKILKKSEHITSANYDESKHGKLIRELGRRSYDADRVKRKVDALITVYEYMKEKESV